MFFSAGYIYTPRNAGRGDKLQSPLHPNLGGVRVRGRGATLRPADRLAPVVDDDGAGDEVVHATLVTTKDEQRVDQP